MEPVIPIQDLSHIWLRNVLRIQWILRPTKPCRVWRIFGAGLACISVLFDAISSASPSCTSDLFDAISSATPSAASVLVLISVRCLGSASRLDASSFFCMSRISHRPLPQLLICPSHSLSTGIAKADTNRARTRIVALIMSPRSVVANRRCR